MPAIFEMVNQQLERLIPDPNKVPEAVNGASIGSKAAEVTNEPLEGTGSVTKDVPANGGVVEETQIKVNRCADY